MLGMSDGAEQLHYLLELEPDSPAFLHDVEAAMPFARNPLYAILHEACWADGSRRAGRRSARCPTVRRAARAAPGEHVFPWMFEEMARSRRCATRRLLAEHEWPRLYDPDGSGQRGAVRRGDLGRDMYVPRALPEETAARVRGLRPWLTSEYEHNALRVDAAWPRAGGRLNDRL